MISQHPPYAPNTASLGGVPTVSLDVPVTVVFLVLFLVGGVSHMTIFQLNNRHGHKFVMSGMMFGFCMARITTCIMRIVWATRPTSVRIAIAAQIFVAAGVVLLFVINTIFAQRIVRASHQHSGWHPAFSHFFQAVYVLIVLSLCMLITATVQSSYTLTSNTRRIDHDIQLCGQTYYVFVSFLPIPLVIGGLIIPRKTRLDKFGSGRFVTKIAILLFSTTLLCLGASFRAGTNYKPARPLSDPAWYHSKACFYIFNFTLEIIVIILYVIVRVDNRFHIPDGSKRAGDYGGTNVTPKDSERTTVRRIMTEEEVFDDAPLRELEKGVSGHRGAESGMSNTVRAGY